MSLVHLDKATSEIRPSAYLDYRLYLGSLYSFIRQDLGRYSYQLFAKELGFGASTVMHQVVKGHRPLSLKAAERVSRALALAGLERKFFLAMVEYCNARTSAKREELFERLLGMKSQTLPDEFDKDCLEYFNEWYHPVIRELVGARGFQGTPEWIAGRITPRVRPEQVKASLALLVRLGFVAIDADRGYVQTKARVSTGHRVQGMGLVRFHQRMIDHAKEALTRVSSQRRDVSAITVSIDEDVALRMRSLIHAFQLQLLDEAEKAGTGDQIYQINIQLFPFTE